MEVKYIIERTQVVASGSSYYSHLQVNGFYFKLGMGIGTVMLIELLRYFELSSEALGKEVLTR